MLEPLKFAVQGRLFHEMPSTQLAEVLKLGVETIRGSDELRQMIIRDQDIAAVEKKKLRQLDGEWAEQQALGSAQRTLFEESDDKEIKMLRTKRRMPPEMVMIFFLIRSYLGNIKSEVSQNYIQDSKTIDYFMMLFDYDKTPGATTIIDNLNCLSTETHDAMLAESLSISKKKPMTKWKKPLWTLLE